MAIIWFVLALPFLVVIGFLAYGLSRLLPVETRDRINALWGSRILSTTWAFETVLVATSVAMYSLCRALDLVPGPSAWPERHGPWRNELPGVLVWSVLIVLVVGGVLQLLFAFSAAIDERNVRVARKAIVASALSGAYLWLCATLLVWTID